MDLRTASRAETAIEVESRRRRAVLKSARDVRMARRKFLLRGALLLLALLLPTSYVSGWSCCRACNSTRDYSRLGWGIGDAWLSMGVGESVRPSIACKDLFPSAHEHEWVMDSESMGGILCLNTLVTGGYKAHGTGYPNAFGNAYAKSPSLRDFLLAGIRSGEVAREEVLAAIRLPRPWDDTETQRALRAKAWAWMKAHAPECPDYYMDGSRYGPHTAPGRR